MPNPENVLKHRMKKGETLNPNGRPRKWVSQLKDSGYKLSEINDTLQVLLQMSEEELQKVYKSKDATILEQTVAKALLNGKTKGSLFNMETLLTRVYGKPKETVDATVNGKYKVTLNIS